MYLQQLNRFSRHDRPTNKKHIFPIGKKAMAPFCHPDGIYQSDMGLFVLGDSDPANASTGYIMIGLGLVCYSISSKVILLSKIWREEFKLANRIPLIPIFTALFCLFLSAFLFEIGGRA